MLCLPWLANRSVVLGPYIADFYCHAPKLIVELDGGQDVERAGYDATRTQVLERMGYRVIRFWNNEVIADMGPVLEQLRLVMLERQKKLPSSYPLPANAGRGTRLGEPDAHMNAPLSDIRDFRL